MLDSHEIDNAHVALIDRIQRQDIAAFEQLYESCHRLVLSFAYGVVRNPVLAEELAQDVFLRVWRDAALYDRERGSVRAWLVIMTRTRALDQLRLSRRRENGLRQWRHAALVEAAWQRSAVVDDGQNAAASAVSEVLPPADRDVMALAFQEGLTHDQIAARLRQPLGTVKTRLRRSVRVLRAAMASNQPPFTWVSWPQLPAAAPGSKTLDNVRLIVVDDDADTLRLLTLVLERAGALVTPAASAAQALRRMSAALPDALLTDIEMPHEDGYSLLARVRRTETGTHRLPAIAFTAHDTVGDRRRVAAAGFSLHIAKPVSPSLLVNHVARLVRPHDTERIAG